MEPLSDELLKQAVSIYRRYRLAMLQSAEGDWSKLGVAIPDAACALAAEIDEEISAGIGRLSEEGCNG